MTSSFPARPPLKRVIPARVSAPPIASPTPSTPPLFPVREPEPLAPLTDDSPAFDTDSDSDSDSDTGLDKTPTFYDPAYAKKNSLPDAVFMEARMYENTSRYANLRSTGSKTKSDFMFIWMVQAGLIRLAPSVFRDSEAAERIAFFDRMRPEILFLDRLFSTYISGALFQFIVASLLWFFFSYEFSYFYPFFSGWFWLSCVLFLPLFGFLFEWFFYHNLAGIPFLIEQWSGLMAYFEGQVRLHRLDVLKKVVNDETNPK